MLVGAALSGCAAARGHSLTPDARAFTSLPRVDFVRPARWFPVSEASGSWSESDPDGSVRSIEHGLRIVERADGRLERASDVLPQGTKIGSLRLPARFGGGFLFFATLDHGTALFRAREWTARLRPLVRLRFETNAVKVGFDRLYAVSNQTHGAVAINPDTGELLGLGALPPSPAYGGMAFSDGWLGAVEVDVRGVMVTFDAGLDWHALRVPITPPGVSERDGRIVLGTARGSYALLPSGELARVDNASSDAVFGEMAAAAGAELDDVGPEPAGAESPFRVGALGARPLEVAVLRGYPLGGDQAVVAANGALARVSLGDGSIVAIAEHAYPSGDACQGVRLGDGIGFVCGEDRGRTRIYAYEPPLALAPVLEFAEPRYVASSGNGTLVVRGPCAPQSNGRLATYCIRASDGSLREITVQGDLGAERVVGFESGSVAVLVPPRLGAPGVVNVVDRSGRTATHEIRFAAVSREGRELITNGFWLDGMIEVEPGVLGGWVAGAQRAAPASTAGPSEGATEFAGVRVSADGKVTVGEIRSGLERASLAGPLAFVADAHGGAAESVDLGQRWSEVALPEGGDLNGDADAGHERGCSPVGCSAGSWLRVGFGKAGEGDLKRTADPPALVVEPTPIVKWPFVCVPTGESEGPPQMASASRLRVRVVAPPSAPRLRSASEDLETSAWRPFLGLPGPELGHDDVGFDFGTEDQMVELRGYAWGPRAAAWDHAGTWLVRAVDRFAVKKAIWSTAPSRSPWPDAAGAAEVFGSDPSHRVVNEWGGLYDSAGDGLLVIMRTGNALSLAVAERDRALVMVGNADDFALDRPAGAAKVGGRWYLGAIPGPRSFHALSIDGGTMSLLGSYPRYSDDAAEPPQIVRTVHGDGVGILVVERGRAGLPGGGDTWFVYPLDTKSGEAGAPLVVDRTAFFRTPRPCDPDEDGWLLVRNVNTSIANFEFAGVPSPPALAKVEARYIAGPAGICIDALAAQVEGDPPKDLQPRNVHAPSRQSVDLALTDRATDRRWGFRCTP